MDWFKDAKRVGMTAIPVGAIGGFLIVLGATTSTTWVLIVGIAMLMVSGGMWAMHGMAEDQQ